MIFLILSLAILTSHGEDLLGHMAKRYSSADGIQWSMRSRVHSPVFDETETTPVEFIFNAPDTFYFKSSQEEILGIADTVWVMSKRHKQIQKKLSEAYIMPTDLIINWSSRYALESYTVSKNKNEFKLGGRPGIRPSAVKITTDKENKIQEIFYKDSSGNDVTLTFKKELLRRAENITLLHLKAPKGYKFIDLTE